VSSSRISLAEALASAPVFVDGDWVESKDQDADGDVRLIQLADVGDGVYVDKSKRFLTSSAATRLKCTFLEPGDVLIARMPDPLGRACIFPGDVKRAVTVVDVCVIRVDPKRMYAPWLVHCINSSTIRNQIAGYVTGTTRQRISRGNLGKIEIELPSLKEQRRIATILDQADVLRAKRREALAQLDSLTQSIFIEMFGEPTSNPKGWKACPFGELAENQDSQRIPVKSSDRDGRQGKYPYYGASGIIDWVDDFIYDGDRLLIGEDGANLVARATPIAYMARGQYWVNNHAHVIAFNGHANLRFLEYSLEQMDLKPYITGSAQPKLNRSNLDRIQIPSPPLALQHSFAARIESVELLKSHHTAALQELDTLFLSLQHRAFAGEL